MNGQYSDGGSGAAGVLMIFLLVISIVLNRHLSAGIRRFLRDNYWWMFGAIGAIWGWNESFYQATDVGHLVIAIICAFLGAFAGVYASMAFRDE